MGLGVAVGLAVALGLGVALGVTDAVAVGVAVEVWDGEGDGEGDGVGVGVGVTASASTAGWNVQRSTSGRRAAQAPSLCVPPLATKLRNAGPSTWSLARSASRSCTVLV